MLQSWRARYLATRAAPLIVFAVTLAALGILLLVRGDHHITASGYAAGRTVDVAPLGSGRVASVLARPGERVRAGQVVARVDDAAAARSVGEARAEQRRLEAELAAAREQTERQSLLDDRTFEQSVEEMTAALTDTRERAAALKVTLPLLEAQLDRKRRLVERQLATEDEVQALLIEHSEHIEELARQEAVASVLEAQLQARESRLGARRRITPASIAPIERALAAVALKIERLEAERAELTLRAPVSGVVDSVMRAPGEVVSSGEVIVRLVEDVVSEAVACVEEADAARLHVGMEAQVWPYGPDASAITGEIASMGSSVASLPGRCPAQGLQPVRGREVRIFLDDVHRLVPGQTLHIRFGGERPRGDDEAAAQLIDLPQRLGAVSRFEPSGLAWVPSLARYLVVSDDTGLGGDDEHHPWLFSMDASGALAPEPIEIHGLSPVSDLEGIAVAPQGDIFITASQSQSRKGNRGPARQRFAHLRLEGGGLAAVHEAPLFTALAASPPAALSALGLGAGLASLDIEGLTWHDGAVYLGLKAPLDADGRALIWRMAHPQRFAQTGRLEDAGLSLWGRVSLSGLRDGAEVPGGISELLFSGGSLLLAATPSTGDVGLVGGTLSLIDQPTGGVMTAVTVRRFDGLKPEGLSPSPFPGLLTLIFDRGDDPASWLEMPWPTASTAWQFTTGQGSSASSQHPPSSSQSPAPAAAAP